MATEPHFLKFAPMGSVRLSESTGGDPPYICDYQTCSEISTMKVVVACVHEHVSLSTACPEHYDFLRRTQDGAWTCSPCWTDHACRAHFTFTPLTEPEALHG